MVLRDRADMTVINRSFFDTYAEQYPEQAKQFLVSDKVDQTYRHQMLLRADAAVPAEAIVKLQKQLEDNGKWPALLSRYHLKLSPPID